MSNIPNLGNLGKKSKDFMGPKPTNLEIMATELLQNCEMKNMNLARQIRTLCILLNIKPADFVKAFADDMTQNNYILETIAEQKKQVEEEKKKKEELAKLAPQTNVQTENEGEKPKEVLSETQTV